MSDTENNSNMPDIFKKIMSKVFSGKLQFTRRKEIDVPEFLNEINVPNRYNYHSFPESLELIGIQAWRSELNSVCVTVVLDRLISSIASKGGKLYFFLWEEKYHVDNYVNLGTIEMISSCIRYEGSFAINDMDVMVLSVDPAATKSEIDVPSQPLAGFSWMELEPDLSFSKVPVSKFGGKYILNFGVCGEFNLSIFFQPSGNHTLQHLFSKSFCCK